MASKGQDKDFVKSFSFGKDAREKYLDYEGNEFLKQEYEMYREKATATKAQMEKEAAEWGMTVDQYKEYIRERIEQDLDLADMKSNPERQKRDEAERKAREEANAKKRAEKAAKGVDPGWAERYLGKKGHSLDSLEEAVWNMSKSDIIKRFPDYGLDPAHSKREMVSMILTKLQEKGYKADPDYKHKWRAKDN